MNAKYRSTLIGAKVRILVEQHKGRTGSVVLEYPESFDIHIEDITLERPRILSYKKSEVIVIEYPKLRMLSSSEEPTKEELERATTFLGGSPDSRAVKSLAKEFAAVRLETLELVAEKQKS